jgi:demethylmenaquinone methyltransferase/2-methoxy-6-polyprenyl-1,4-benzoquinol methylase
MNLPFRSRSVDAVTVGFGVRNFADVRRGLEEIVRVLRPGGQFMVLEFYRDDPAADGEHRGVPGPLRFGLNSVIPWLGKLVGRDRAAYSYLPSSMGEFLTPEEFRRLLTEYGFVETFVERQTFGIAHIVGGRLDND